MEYYILFCQEHGKEEDRDVVEDFCTGEQPDTAFLKQVGPGVCRRPAFAA